MGARKLPWRLFSGILFLHGCHGVQKSPPRLERAQQAWSAPRLSVVRPPYESVLIDGVPHVQQRPDFCGEAAAASWLAALGAHVDQDRVFALSGIEPARGMGATTRELATALDRLGFDIGPVWYSIPAGDPSALEALFANVVDDLQRRVPSIVCMHYDERPNTSEHFRLVLGYDAITDEVVYHEPAEERGAYRRMPRERFVGLWPLKYDPARWTVVRLRLAGSARELPPRPPGFSPADYAQHVRRLKQRVPPGFEVLVEPPFVVVGDDSPSRVRATADQIVRWAVDRLERDFFDHEPGSILDIFLFKDRGSYESHTESLFGEQPSTPYGFYSSEHGALVMNIATGGGTLVHEIVHPFIEANFPDCPAWFNEGLGSLFEQSQDRDGHIVGLTNWRLRGLQRAIRRGKLPSFRTLTATTSHAFYEEDPGTNYAQSRYLLYHLQEHGLLRRYYKEFVAHRYDDPTGYETFSKVLGGDMDGYQRRWEEYVLALHFP